MDLSNEDLRRLQLVEYDLICEVDRICKKNGIKYTLYAGTLLGAVRHKGFIPWDDDADIAFFPEEYEKFFEACKRDLNTEKYFLQDYRTDKYYRWGYAKLRRNNSAFLREGQEHMKFHNGICIDLFTLYSVPDSKILRKIYFDAFFCIRKVLYSEVGKTVAPNRALRALYKLLSLIPKDAVFKFVNAILYQKPSELVNILYMPTPSSKYGIPRRCLSESIPLQFENRLFSAMAGYDEVLRIAYGDYMVPPPEVKRASHNPASAIRFPDGDTGSPESRSYHMKKVLFFGAPVFQIPVIEKAKQMGLHVGVIDIDPMARAIPYADEYFSGSLKDNEEMLRIARQFQPDGIVIGACDTSVVSASYVCEKLDLPGHSVKTAVTSTDKLQMLLAFEKYGVSHPAFQFIPKESVGCTGWDHPYPAISKPVDSSGSRGICYIADAGFLADAMRYSSNAGRSGDILVEEYMCGPEVSVEVLVVDSKPYILQITDKITSGPPYFFEVGHSQPSVLPENVQQQIRELAKRAAIAVGIVNGPAHVEIKVTEDGPKIVELGARLGGGCISTYLLDTSVAGICLSEATIRLALGEKPDVSHYHNSGNAVAVRFILAEEGTIRSISGLEDASAMSGVITLQFFGSVGQTHTNTADNASRLGFVVAKGKTTAEALTICENAINRISVTYDGGVL